MNDVTEKQVLALIAKAADAHDSADAMRFTQAALNAANTLAVLSQIPPEPVKRDEPLATSFMSWNTSVFSGVVPSLCRTPATKAELLELPPIQRILTAAPATVFAISRASSTQRVLLAINGDGAYVVGYLGETDIPDIPSLEAPITWTRPDPV